MTNVIIKPKSKLAQLAQKGKAVKTNIHLVVSAVTAETNGWTVDLLDTASIALHNRTINSTMSQKAECVERVVFECTNPHYPNMAYELIYLPKVRLVILRYKMYDVPFLNLFKNAPTSYHQSPKERELWNDKAEKAIVEKLGELDLNELFTTNEFNVEPVFIID